MPSESSSPEQSSDGVEPAKAEPSGLSPVTAGSLAGGRVAAYGWLGFALLLFLVQALPNLSYRWLPDESWYSGPAYSIAHGNGVADPAMGPNDLEHRLDARPPGTAMAISVAFRLFGAGQISARLPFILAGLAIILLTYRLARDVIGEKGALVAAFIVATDNLVVLACRTARPESITLTSILLSLLAMKHYARKDRVGWAFLSGLLIAMGTMCHITLAGYIVSLGLLAIVLGFRSGRFRLRGAVAYVGGYGLGLVPFVIWILTNPLGREGFRQEYLNRAGGAPLWTKFLLEGSRYKNLFGLDMLHWHGLESVPVRLPIPLLFLAATVILWKLRRRWFQIELLLLIPTALWLIYTVNKSPRYLALLAPVFALAIGGAISATLANRKLHRALLYFAGLVVAAQMGANILLLFEARKANYDKVAAGLRSVIPVGQVAYGTVTFWLALHDRTFISYERTDPRMAARDYHARYFITNDRVMVNGLPGEDVFYDGLRRGVGEIVAQSKLVGNFPDAYYGDLKVYELQGSYHDGAEGGP